MPHASLAAASCFYKNTKKYFLSHSTIYGLENLQNICENHYKLGNNPRSKTLCTYIPRAISDEVPIDRTVFSQCLQTKTIFFFFWNCINSKYFLLLSKHTALSTDEQPSYVVVRIHNFFRKFSSSWGKNVKID